MLNMVKYESSLGSCFDIFYHSVPVRDCMIRHVTRLACAPNGNGLQPNLVMASNLRVMAMLQDLKQNKKHQRSQNKYHLQQEDRVDIKMPGKFWTMKVLRACQAVGCL